MTHQKIYAAKWMLRSARFYSSKIFQKLKKVVTGKQSREFAEIDNQYAPIIRAAKRMNIPVEEIFPGFYELKKGNKKFWYYYGYSLYDSAIGLKIAGNKYVTSKILSDLGMPVPRGRAFALQQLQEAIAYFRESSFPRAVVKPARSTYGGKGVNTYVKTVKDLKSAVMDAMMYDDYFQLEEYVEGNHYRLLIFRDELLSAPIRIPARIKGDGVHSIASLIKRENKRRIAREYDGPPLWPIDIDSEMKQCLAEQGLSLASVPEKDEMIALKSICNYHKGGEAYEVYEQVHPATVEACITIMKHLGISLAGFDVITPDIGVPILEQGIFNEVNTTPNLQGHYDVNNQEKARDVAGAILKRVFEMEEREAARM